MSMSKTNVKQNPLQQNPAGAVGRPSGSSARSRSRSSSPRPTVAVQKTTSDAEAQSLGICLEALKNLQPDARRRVMAYLGTRYNIPVAWQPAQAQGAEGESGETGQTGEVQARSFGAGLGQI